MPGRALQLQDCGTQLIRRQQPESIGALGRDHPVVETIVGSQIQDSASGRRDPNTETFLDVSLG